MNNLNYTIYILLSSLTQRTIESTKKTVKARYLPEFFFTGICLHRTEIWYVLKGLVLQKYGSSTTREDLI